MANSDKNILITPNVSAATGTYPNIKFNGANNTPITLSVLDDGTVSFSGTAGQLFSVSDGLSGTIFSVNDISGIPSIEVLDTGLVKLNQYNGSTVFGASAAIQNSSSVNAKVSISTASASTPGLIIKAFSSQTANLQEWQNSSGTALVSIQSDGSFKFNDSVNGPGTFYWGAANIGGFGGGAGLGNTWNFVPYNSARVAVIVQGASSQTADLQQWRNSSGTVLASVDKDGYLQTPRLVITTGGNITDSAGTTPYFGFGSNQIAIYTRNAAYKGLIIQGSASQTANLQEWQDSAGTVLTSIGPTGGLFVSQGIQTGTSFTGVAFNGFSNPSGYTTIPSVVVKGVTSQTADLQQWQNSSGTVLTSIDSAGRIFTKDYLTVERNVGAGGTVLAQSWSWNGGANWGLRLNQVYSTSPSGSIDYHFITRNNSFSTDTNVMFIKASGLVGFNIINQTSAQVFVNNSTAANVGLIVKGAASQSANLQEWQDSAGNILSRISSAGSIFASTSGTRLSGVNGDLIVNAASATVIPIIARGFTSQTADLQQWQNSAGTVLANADAYANFYVPHLYSNGNVRGAFLITTNSYAGLTEENSGGRLRLVKMSSSATAPGADTAKIYLVAGTNAGTLKLVVRAGASGAETTILDNIPQS